MWSLLATKYVCTLFPESMAIFKFHQNRKHKNLQSTKKFDDITNDIFPTILPQVTNAAFVAFKYLFILHHYDTNIILLEPMVYKSNYKVL